MMTSSKAEFLARLDHASKFLKRKYPDIRDTDEKKVLEIAASFNLMAVSQTTLGRLVLAMRVGAYSNNDPLNVLANVEAAWEAYSAECTEIEEQVKAATNVAFPVFGLG